MSDLANLPVIILAGGFGTRLQHVLENVPKPMAPINGRPFLALLLDYLDEEGIRKVILATGHKAEVIQSFFGYSYKGLSLCYSHEENPLGTGGAILQAFDSYDLSEAIVLNGDTFFPVSLSRLYYFHRQFEGSVTVAMKYMRNFARYGTISWTPKNKIEKFNEKLPQKEGFINGGIYVVNKKIFASLRKECFSFEKEILESTDSLNFYGLPFSEYFIDIGVPDDYTAFQQEQKKQYKPSINQIDTLFIDRDGVVNKRIPNDYVRKSSDFVFLEGAKSALQRLRLLGNHMFIVTNQQGIGKGLMTEVDLEAVHDYFVTELEKLHVTVDAIYYAPGLASDDPDTRKPNVGMAFQAKTEFQEIDYSSCVMIGDSTSDIEFGLRMGMYTILVGEKSSTTLAHHSCYDLKAAADHLSQLSM